MKLNLYLSFDVNHAVVFGSCYFKQLRCSASCEQFDGSILFQEQLLRAMVQDEARTLLVGLKAQLFGDETDFYVWFVSAQISGFP